MCQRYVFLVENSVNKVESYKGNFALSFLILQSFIIALKTKAKQWQKISIQKTTFVP